ncbi:tail fiber protein [Comamonas testosteroni]|nr:tail fiber protein [Comamonas testosteroni]
MGTSTTQLATTAFVIGQAGTAAPKMDAVVAVGTATRFAREDHVHPTDTSRAPLASPGLTGTPTAPTAADGTNTTQLASTAFVQNAVGGYLAKGVTGGTVTLTEAEASNPVIALTGALTSALNLVVPVTVKRIWAIYNSTTGAFGVTVKTANGTGVAVAQGKRNLVYTDGTNVYDGFNDFDNIAITGTSTAPTAAVGTSTTQLATTAFVIGQAGTAAPKIDGAAAVGTATRFAREDHVHPTDTSRAPLASPGLTGTPTAPTAAAGTSSTQIASTAFVQGAVSDHIPTGSVFMYAGSTVPAGCLKTNGAAVSRTTYAKLFAVIGTRFGAGDGSTTFNVPETRGEFPRFWDDGRGIDTSRVLGSAQIDALQSHYHALPTSAPAGPAGTEWGIRDDVWQWTEGGSNPNPATSPPQIARTWPYANGEAWEGRYAGETRPRNVAFMGLIKYL